MTVEELIDSPPLDSCTDLELENYLRRYFPFTRPKSTMPAGSSLADKFSEALGESKPSVEQPVVIKKLLILRKTTI